MPNFPLYLLHMIRSLPSLCLLAQLVSANVLFDCPNHGYRYARRRVPRALALLDNEYLWVISGSRLTAKFRQSWRTVQETPCTARYSDYHGSPRDETPGSGVATLCPAASVNTFRSGSMPSLKTGRSTIRFFRTYVMECDGVGACRLAYRPYHVDRFLGQLYAADVHSFRRQRNQIHQ